MAGAAVPELVFQPLSNTKDRLTTEQLRDGKILVLDLWTTRCERCPAALDKLERLARRYKANGNVIFAGVNADDIELAAELVEENDWDTLTHVYIDEDSKNVVKAKLGLQSVPFYIIIGKDGKIAQCGTAKDVDFERISTMLEDGQSQLPSFELNADF